MKGVTKTISVYGFLGVIVTLMAVFIEQVTGNTKTLALYVAPVAAFGLLAALFIDSFGCLCLLLAWLPFSFGPGQVEIGIVTLTPYFVGIFVLTFLILLRAVVGLQSYNFSKTDIVLGLLCFTYLASTLLSDALIESGYLAFRGIFIPVLSYFVVKGMAKTDDQQKQAVAFMVVGAAAFSILAIGQFIATHERVELLGVAYIGVATFAITGAFYSMYLGWWKRKVGLVALILCLAGLVLTLSRVYLLLLLLSPLVFRAFRKGRAFSILVLMIALTLAGTLLVTASSEAFRPAKIESVKKEATSERITRLDFWKAALYGRTLTYQEGIRKFLSHPLFGTGLRKGEYTVTTHNFHIEWLEYGGVVGYLLYAAVFFLHFRRFARHAVHDRFVAVNLLIIFTVLVNSVTNGFMHGIMPYIAWIAIGFNESRRKISGTVQVQTMITQRETRMASVGGQGK